MVSTTDIGRRGEDAAADYLESLGYVVFERNYRFERAEVDLVCFKATADGRRGEIVFVEVKARSGSRFGRPEEAVDQAKIANVRRAASAWLYEQKMESAPCRFDVVSVLFDQGDTLVEHFERAF
ncbi:MAG: YraN family protein [Rhodothermales bacterium]|nr:YraN family protein [Rhodothermales bacterium]